MTESPEEIEGPFPENEDLPDGTVDQPEERSTGEPPEDTVPPDWASRR
jgi:hypothetical protein